jgi:FAD:protein FMN transferase
MEYHDFRAMNTGFTLAAEGEAEAVGEAFKLAQVYIEDCEQRFSRFLPESELSQLNRSAGGWFMASPALFQVVSTAYQYYCLTGGLFDPSILPALKRAGYDRSMDEIRKDGPGSDHYPAGGASGSFKRLRLEKGANRIWLPEGVEIDLGGIAKGWAAEGAAKLLSRYSTACAVDAGGDIALVGLPEGQERWEVGLEDPLDPQRTLATLRVEAGAIATSSVVKRAWVKDGKVQHHLIDPRSGEPAATDWISATVIAPSAAEAEVYAKVVLISGPQGMQAQLNKHPGLAFLAVDPQGKLWGSPAASELMKG